ncbi:MAG: hypothetical protein AB7I04_15110 [Pseudomonadales bacterium]
MTQGFGIPHARGSMVLLPRGVRVVEPPTRTIVEPSDIHHR